MNKERFLKMLRNHPGWENMTRKGEAGIVVLFGGVDFLLFRDNALHYLRAVPQNATSLAVVRAFNALMGSCRRELAEDLERWNMVRLTRDDNEGGEVMCCIKRILVILKCLWEKIRICDMESNLDNLFKDGYYLNDVSDGYLTLNRYGY